MMSVRLSEWVSECLSAIFFFFVQNGSNSQIRWTDISNSRIQARRAWRLVNYKLKSIAARAVEKQFKLKIYLKFIMVSSNFLTLNWQDMVSQISIRPSAQPSTMRPSSQSMAQTEAGDWFSIELWSDSFRIRPLFFNLWNFSKLNAPLLSWLLLCTLGCSTAIAAKFVLIVQE